MNTSDKNLRFTIKDLAIVGSCYGMICTFNGLMAFTYFTNLSNIFIDVMLAIFLVQELKGTPHSNTLYRVKYLATVSITLTFLVYLFILAPNMNGGVINSYFGHGAGSFFVHFWTPALAIVDFVLFDYEFKPSKSDIFWGIVPPLSYVGFVVIASQLGMRWNGDMYAPYNFLNYGAPVGWFGFDLSQMGWETFGVGVFYMIVIIALLFVGLDVIFLRILKHRSKNKS